MNPGHFQMRRLRKSPLGGLAGAATAVARDGGRAARRVGRRFEAATPGPDGPFSSQRGFGCHFLSHITSRSSAVLQLSSYALNPQDRLKVVSQERQGTVAAPRLWILAGQPRGARPSSSLFDAGSRERYYEFNTDARRFARPIKSIGCEHFVAPLGRRPLASKLRLVEMIE